MPENNKTFCPHCGQSYMKNAHTFSKSLAQILLKVARTWKEGVGFHLQKDLELTSNQYANFQKLRYWGLVDYHYENGHHKGGYWHLTHAAQYALDGGDINKSVTTFNNKVVERSSEMVILKKLINFYEIPNTWAKKAVPVEQVQMEMFK